MNKPEFQNAIRVNHRGFLRESAKRFILAENKTDNDTFRVIFIDDVKYIPVLEGKMTPVYEGNNTYWIGDFSEIKRDGDYYIEAGSFRSRQFVIYDGAYDICKRVLLEYFTYQRCGHPLGWNGKCHTDDGIIAETGERVDLSGGYHQSCDLRKSPGGVSIGVLGMMRFAMKDRSEWGKILVVDEVRWALMYYVKTIQKNGAMYNTLNAPFGWDARIFYESPAPSSAQWNVTSILALGYEYFKDTDRAFADKCLELATRSYGYLMGDKRPTGVYKHPDKYPMGMDPDFFYNQCERDSTADLAYQICVSGDIYRITGREEYRANLEKALIKLLPNIKDGYILVRNGGHGGAVTASCSYTWLNAGILALCDAYEILGDSYGLKSKIIHALEEICEFADKSVFKNLQRVLFDEDLDEKTGHLNKTRRESEGELGRFKGYYYPTKELFEPSYSCYLGIFLAKGSKITGNKKYMAYAQYVADDLLGANLMDSSHVNSIGFNHAQHEAYGQFFPSTPFIPGAVAIGYKGIDVYTQAFAEYDMPCVGLSMHLLSELSD